MIVVILKILNAYDIKASALPPFFMTLLTSTFKLKSRLPRMGKIVKPPSNLFNVSRIAVNIMSEFIKLPAKLAVYYFTNF